ncbi:alpha/beta hydrolase [Dactylosporangium sp. NPDC051485]|uniref:alpha/beta fold hydrolase n=1 Tax=Dactylosporangium sp. NPDC051485 TaxID=3154846 RepID=UPI0034285CEC
MPMNRRRALAAGLGAAALVNAGLPGVDSAAGRAPVPSDAELAGSLAGGFGSFYADVNGTRLHYVSGGQGEPVFLLPGWPATWWTYRKVMPILAERYRVVVPDLRGMGGLARPLGGFDKKTMARDIYALARKLGYESVNIAGHDIGAMVAFSFAANHPDATRSVALLDVLHPDRGFYEWRLIQPPGGGVNMWWMAFNQVDGLPEELLAGRARHLIDWHYGIGLVDQSNVSDRDRAVFAHAYDTANAIRAGNGWYKAFQQDIADMDTYAKVTAPLLGLVAPATLPWFQATLPNVATDVRGIVTVDKALHWLADEDPELVARSLAAFFG